MIGRDYQERAIEAAYRALRKTSANPCIVIPTGGGKSFVVSRICRDAVSRWNGRVIILSHVKEILTQLRDHLLCVDPTLAIGVYSAGLGSKDVGYPVTIAGIQSIYKRAKEIPPPNLIIVDEAHRIPEEGEGMYQRFLSEMKERNPKVRLIGLTATPYRTGSGYICGPESLLNRVCFEVSIRELIAAGYLSPLTTKGGTEDADLSGVGKRAGEFIQDQLEKVMNDERLIVLAVSDILSRAYSRKSILIFCTGVDHAKNVAKILSEASDQEVGMIFGETPSDERANTIRKFREGTLRYLVNCQVLTNGFDAPNVDCVALMRPTMSPGLFVQMVGRGFRTHPNKINGCLVLDFGQNIMRHGPVDEVQPNKKGNGEAPIKKCPDCSEFVHLSVKICPDCGCEFPPPEDTTKHEAESSKDSILSAVEEAKVESVSYEVWTKRNADLEAPKTMKVKYKTGLISSVSEWVCLEHGGYAHDKATTWWRRRGKAPMPQNSAEAVARSKELLEPTAIQVSIKGKFPEIVGFEFPSVK